LTSKPGHVLLLEVALVELENQTALCDVSLEGCDVDRGGHFDGRLRVSEPLWRRASSHPDKQIVIVGVFGTFRASTISIIRGKP
jgi:hypothetical protein